MSDALPPPGPSFVIPPAGRLFAVFDTLVDATAAFDALVGTGLVTPSDIWAYARDSDADLLDPRHVTGPVRLLQLLLSSDVEYRTGLANTVRSGGAVLVIKVAKPDIPGLLPLLKAHGGRSLACKRSLNFIPAE